MTDIKRPPRDNLARAVFPGVELRGDEDDAAGPPLLAGHFSKFNHWYEVNSLFEGHFLERTAPGAFRKTFKENRQEIRALFQHGQDPQIGDKVLGPIQLLEEDGEGARFEVPLLDTSYNRDLIPGLQAGLYGSSFRFNVVKDDWDDKPKRAPHNPDGLPERTVREARVWEFGPVTFPASPAATAGVRSMTDFIRDPGGSTLSMRADALPPDGAEALPHSDEGSRGEATLATMAAKPFTASVTVDPPTPEQETRPMTVEERTSRQTEIKSRLAEIDNEYAGEAFPNEIREEWNNLDSEHKDNERVLAEVGERRARLEQFSSQAPQSNGNVHEGWAAPQMIRKPAVADIYDFSQIRSQARTQEDETVLLRDNAKRAVEIAAFPNPAMKRDQGQENVTRLLDTADDEQGTVARRVLATGSPVYKRAFGKYLAQQPLTNDEARALSLTGASGGFAVPFDLDPTILGTSNGAVNPMRAISRVIPITGDEWRGVTSAGITTAYAAEATETTDNAPTLVQPTISTEKAQAFIPFSIEVGMDWPGLQGEMARLLAESKDELEATKFTVGSGTNEPFGFITGATTTVNATAAGVFDIEDLYRLSAALPARYRARASFVASLDIFNKVRQFDTSGGAALWETLANDQPPRLLGKPAYENSAMATVTTVGALFLAYGDFSRFVIVDRIGLDIELIQHLVGTNHRPTGQRGLYAYWRNGSKVVDANAFRVLIGLA